MPSSFEKYRMVDGQTPLSARYFNPIWKSLDVRLGDLEAVRASWLDAVQEVTQLGLERINALVGQPMEMVNATILELREKVDALPAVILRDEFEQTAQDQAQAMQQLVQALQTLQQTLQQSLQQLLPQQTGHAGQWLSTDGAQVHWGTPTVPSVTELQRGTALKRQLLGINAAGAVVGMAPLELLDHADRAQLRTLTSGTAIVRGLGVFTWEADSTECDDDETCFATTGGAWLLTAAGPDAVRALLLPEVSALQSALARHMGRFVAAGFEMTATALAANAEVVFTAVVDGAIRGDSVVVTPFGAVDRAVSSVGVVTAQGAVTVSVRNASASTVTMTPGTWTVLVIKTKN